MHGNCRFIVVAAAIAALVSCQKGSGDGDKDKEKPTPAGATTGAASQTKTPAPTSPHGTKPVKDIEPPMDVSAPPATAIKTDGGLQYVVLAAGKGGEKPGRNDTVRVNYTGWKTDGTMFFSSQRRGRPQPMRLPQLPTGWRQMLQDMTVSEKRLVWMPPAMATRSKNPVKGETLVFQIEMVGIDPAPPVPKDLTAPPADAIKLPSGLVYKTLQDGKGTEKPRSWDQVTVHYSAWSTDGLMFDSTGFAKRPRPVNLSRESKGFGEAIQQMVQGQKIRAWIPEKLVDKRPRIPDGNLVYDIELVTVKKMPEPPPVPKDVAAPPKNAKKTKLGVFYKVLKKGTGKVHPTRDKTVRVHYSGWTTDGKMFDSSVTRGKPLEFPLSGVIAGWTDGLQVMVTGEKTRFWIPAKLAYEGKSGPQGMLVFDVELLAILDAPARPKRPMPSGHPQFKPKKKDTK